MVAALAGWTAFETLRQRQRQRAWAMTRPATTRPDYVAQMRAADVSTELAEWLWEQLTPYHFRPLTPCASDRIYGDLRIDPDDISDIALRYEKAFCVRLVGNPIPTPADPTWAELCVAFERHGFI